MTLHVNTFAGGVALLGSADTRAVDEVLQADSCDIGPRGALVCASDVSPYLTINDLDTSPVPLMRVYGLLEASGATYSVIIAVGQGRIAGGGQIPAHAPTVFFAPFNREGQSSPLSPPTAGAEVFDTPNGAYVTSAVFSGTFYMAPTVGTAVPINVFLVCVGCREGTVPNVGHPNVGFGLQLVVFNPDGTVNTILPISAFDALGTGSLGELSLAGVGHGTKAQQLFFRGIIAYNNFVMGWGFDSADTVNGDGPCRVMFCNIGNPLKWGNDNISVPPPEIDRLFTDSDAIGLGGAGEIIRAGLVIFGKAFFGTNRAIQFIQGFGRDSFITNGAIPVMKSYNVVGPKAMIEGPDRLMYGVCDQGLWQYDGYNVPVPLFQKLVDFAGHSVGYWDLMWTNPNALPNTYPGGTNQDLIWMASDYTRQQVLVGIPFCNTSSGVGEGNDTVVIKYHIRGGGFTRQVFPGVCYTAAGYFRREGQQNEARLFGTATSGATTIQRYAYQTTLAESPVMPTILPAITLGYYSPFGPDGQGVVQRAYLTVAWQNASFSLPLVFGVTFTVDQALVDSYTLYIQPSQPGSPTQGDCWLDTSQSNQSIGNARSSANIPAVGGYLFNVYDGGRWLQIAGQGTKGNRCTMTLPLIRRQGCRVTVGLQCVSANGRFEVEGFGIMPGSGTPNA